LVRPFGLSQLGTSTAGSGVKLVRPTAQLTSRLRSPWFDTSSGIPDQVGNLRPICFFSILIGWHFASWNVIEFSSNHVRERFSGGTGGPPTILAVIRNVFRGVPFLSV